MVDIIAPKPRTNPGVPAPQTPPKPQSQPPVEPPSPSQTPVEQRPRGKKWKIWATIIAVLILLAAAGAALGYFWYKDALGTRSAQYDKIRFVVEPGASAEKVSSDLEKKGIVKSGFAVYLHMKWNDKGAIKAGKYLFSPNQPATEVVDWLNDGRFDTFKVTILPAKTLADIKERLIKSDYSPQEIDAALAKQYNHPLLKEKPADNSLEGYIYPETYFVSSDTTVEELFVLTFDEFEKQIKKNDLRTRLAARGFTLHQGIILASLIEGEVPGEQDRRQVAQVFEKRLKIDMELGSDVSYKYAAKMLGIAPSPNIDSPYNTRKHKGYPPGPVGNFTLDALTAVANPAPGDYLYFVSGDDGTTHFSNTFEEHEANIRQYCHELCASN
ncbi:MAG: endolytic transglycosylase MltG [Candidatus Saccharimonadales bacterium]